MLLFGVRTPPVTLEEFLESECGLMSNMNRSKATIHAKLPNGCPGIVRQGNRAYPVSPIYAQKLKDEETEKK